ncbi:MAG: phosphoadenosine phosphosulfate reductase family protein [Candidatus Hodarchaeota archaeon]
MTKKKRRGKKFRRSHAPYLTKIRFFWCDTCNVPRTAETECGICGSKPRSVPISPPGDPFPAMEGHLEQAIAAIDEQYGDGIGAAILPPTKTIVLNKIPSLDAMFEIIVDGFIIGKMRFEIPKRRFSFILTLEGGRRIGQLSRQKWVSCKEGVLEYLKNGANLLLPGIAGCDSEIKEKDDVWVVDTEGSVIAVGIARMSGEEMAKEEKGFAIKIREVADPEAPRSSAVEASWDKAVLANKKDLTEIENEAIGFVRRTRERYDLPVVVGFSGGKDSLATYLVVEKALDESPPLFFMDTGIELPETTQYVKEFASKRDARIIGQDAGNRFWESIDTFGPPARDFRWCCKILKLGPAATSIDDEMGGRTLSFMGQRKLESFQRSVEPRVTSNPWVPGQTSANPIQRWNALEVWLYIFRENAPFNILYNHGYHRMGCYLCPASPLAEIESLRGTHPELHSRWAEKMQEWAEKLGFPNEWVDFGFWRWKKLPPGQMLLIESLNLPISADRPGPSQQLELNVVKGISPCVDSGFSLEGQFTSGIDLNRVGELMPIFGNTRVSEEMGALRAKSRTNSIALFSSGSLVVRGDEEKQVEELTEQVGRAVKRALFCQACGSCIPQCEYSALSIVRGKVTVDPARCKNCLKCDTWPCPTYLT